MIAFYINVEKVYNKGAIAPEHEYPFLDKITDISIRQLFVGTQLQVYPSGAAALKQFLESFTGFGSEGEHAFIQILYSRAYYIE